jgi:hypothetical protein
VNIIAIGEGGRGQKDATTNQKIQQNSHQSDDGEDQRLREKTERKKFKDTFIVGLLFLIIL